MTSPAVGRSSPEVPASQSLPEMVVPAYQSTTLGELMPSIGAHIGVPGYTEDAFRLPHSARYVVVLIDGLGWNLLRRGVIAAPFLASLLGGAQPITSAVPSTTVTSLGSLGTGQPPGQHGLVGYTSRVPSTGEILNGLTWESDLVPTVYQSKPTFFERASKDRRRGYHGRLGAVPGHRAYRGRAPWSRFRPVLRRKRRGAADRVDR